MADANVHSQGTVFRSPYLYCAHPHAIATASGEVIVVFNRTRRNGLIFHPPHDPDYRNFLSRSADGGSHWSTPQVVPDYATSGTECASLTRLRSGRLLLNQWQSRWYPLDLARRTRLETVQEPVDFVSELIVSAELDTGERMASAPEVIAPWARGHGSAFTHVSDDGGASFRARALLDTGPFHGGYGMRGACELADGRLLLVLNDIPEFETIFTLESRDQGLSWDRPQLVARAEGHLFTEAALVETADGSLLCMMRDDRTRIMHQCRSRDGGRSWDRPASNGIDGYPPHLLPLPDGRILCTYGSRKPEYSIRAVVSADGGASWSREDPLMIRRHLPNRDLGYPATVLLPDDSFLTVYYCQDAAGITGIEWTRWRF